jgi:CubicO group peptidase (beta-lactamase class C family)
MLNWAAMTDALAEEEPWWEPGTAHGYHVNTYGYLIGEVIRRVSGRTPGAYLREEIAGPLGADVHIGLEATEDVRVARYLWPSGDRRSEAAQRFEGSTPIGDERPELEGDRLMVYHAYFNPRGASGTGVVNTREWRAAEIPSTNGHATARGVARVYQALANRGEVDGIRVVDAQALDEATREWSNGHDRVLDRPSRFGLGFQLTQPERPLGPGRNGFGHFGAGGSLGFCDPDAGLAFGYVMNQMGPNWQNPRNRGLIDAVYASLGAG